MGMNPLVRPLSLVGPLGALPLSLVVGGACCTRSSPRLLRQGRQDWTFVDNLNHLSHLADYSHFPGMGIDTTNTAYFDGDPARLNRDATNAAYATWQASQMQRVEADIYFWPQEAYGPLTMAVSSPGDELVHDGPDDHAYRWRAPGGTMCIPSIVPPGTNDVRF